MDTGTDTTDTSAGPPNCRQRSDRIPFAIGLTTPAAAKNKKWTLVGKLQSPVLLRSLMVPNGYDNVAITDIMVDGKAMMLGEAPASMFTTIGSDAPSTLAHMFAGMVAHKTIEIRAWRWPLRGHGEPVISVSGKGIKIKFRFLKGARTAPRRKPLQFAFFAESVEKAAGA